LDQFVGQSFKGEKKMLLHLDDLDGEYRNDDDKLVLCEQAVRQYFDIEIGVSPSKIELILHKDPEDLFISLKRLHTRHSSEGYADVKFPEDTWEDIGGFTVHEHCLRFIYESLFKALEKFQVDNNCDTIYVELKIK
jgi:hypothetical protein